MRNIKVLAPIGAIFEMKMDMRDGTEMTAHVSIQKCHSMHHALKQPCHRCNDGGYYLRFEKTRTLEGIDGGKKDRTRLRSDSYGEGTSENEAGKMEQKNEVASEDARIHSSQNSKVRVIVKRIGKKTDW
jgi:hypothetical protein